MARIIVAMLQLSASLLDRPVLSLRTGGKIAHTVSAIVDPNNLKIEGFYCQDALEHRQPILLSQDIRDVLPQGIVVNDHDALTDTEDLVRFKDLLELNFRIVGKKVITVSKQRLGKIEDFATDTQSMYIQKLYAGPSLIKTFTGSQLSIDRSQIVEITTNTIIVQDLAVPAGTAMPSPAQA